MYNLVRILSWLPADAYVMLKLRWIPSGENSEADKLARPGRVEPRATYFYGLWKLLGSFDTHLMASAASAQ